MDVDEFTHAVGIVRKREADTLASELQ
jgi:hypothetical protein